MEKAGQDLPKDRAIESLSEYGYLAEAARATNPCLPCSAKEALGLGKHHNTAPQRLLFRKISKLRGQELSSLSHRHPLAICLLGRKASLAK